MGDDNGQPVRAGLYLRLSKLKDTSMISLERQETIDRAICAELGWEPAEVYSDEGRSAFNRQTRRKGFDDMVADAKRGHINALVTVADDRFSRNERDALALLDLADEYGVRLATNTDRWDLRTATGRRHFRASMNDAIFSSERQSERTKLGLASVAERGGWGGGIRPFGYSLEPQPAGRLIKYRLEPNPAEAELLREAVSRILLGGSLTAVVKDWAHRKPPVRGSKGGRLNTQRLRQILTGPAIAGLRVNGVDKGGNEIFVAAEWEPIIPRPEWERLRLILADPPRQRGPKGPRLYLLGVDLLECACTGRMAPHPRPGGRRGYQCDAQKGGCGKLRRTAIPLEDHVRDMALKALSSEETRAELVAQLPDVDATARAQQLIADREAQRARLVKLRDKLADDAIDDDDFAHAKARITARIDEIEAQLARTADTSSALIATLPSTFEALRAAWETWPLDQRRAVVKLVIRKVRITGRLTPGTRFADDQVEIDWRV